MGDGPGRIPVGALLVKRCARRDLEECATLRAERVQCGRGDLGGERADGIGQPEGAKHLVGQQLRHLLAGGFLQRQAEQHVVGVRVVPVGSRLVEQRLIDGVLQHLVDGPAPERVGVEGFVHLGVADDVIDVARGHLGQLAQRDLVGVGDLRQIFRELVVEAQLLLVDEFEQQGGDVGDRDRAVAEVHVGGRGHAGHRLADGLGDDLLPVDGDADDDRLQVLCAMVSRTTRITASASAVSVVGDGVSPGSAPGAQPVSRTRAQSAESRRRTTGIPGSWQSDRADCVNQHTSGHSHRVCPGRVVPHAGERGNSHWDLPAWSEGNAGRSPRPRGDLLRSPRHRGGGARPRRSPVLRRLARRCRPEAA